LEEFISLKLSPETMILFTSPCPLLKEQGMSGYSIPSPSGEGGKGMRWIIPNSKKKPPQICAGFFQLFRGL